MNNLLNTHLSPSPCSNFSDCFRKMSLIVDSFKSKSKQASDTAFGRCVSFNPYNVLKSGEHWHSAQTTYDDVATEHAPSEIRNAGGSVALRQGGCASFSAELVQIGDDFTSRRAAVEKDALPLSERALF